MSAPPSRTAPHHATVTSKEQLSDHLVRLRLTTDGTLSSTGVPDEWLAVTVPGQFQSRYYTVRSLGGPDGRDLVLDVVVHDEGLVTGWAQTDCVGDEVGLSAAKGSFALPDDAGWVVLAGDLTALPAMARICEHLEGSGLPLTVHAESPDGEVATYLPGTTTWHDAEVGESNLAALVGGLTWPDGPGYFWMAGESAQMRAVRKHLMRERRLPPHAYQVMGYWRAVDARQPRAVDPGPIWRAGKAAGKSDEQIWAEYDEARS